VVVRAAVERLLRVTARSSPAGGPLARSPQVMSFRSLTSLQRQRHGFSGALSYLLVRPDFLEYEAGQTMFLNRRTRSRP
jgi:hypothetical protein